MLAFPPFRNVLSQRHPLATMQLWLARAESSDRLLTPLHFALFTSTSSYTRPLITGASLPAGLREVC
jgi:hypothetical protein